DGTGASRMILSIIRTGFMNLRRDRGALTLSFIVPIAFFSIFAGIFGSRNGGTSPIPGLVVDQDRTEVSKRFVEAWKEEGGLRVQTGQDAASAERAVRAGDLGIAIVIPSGFGSSPIGFENESPGTKLHILNDSSDPIAAQVVYGLIQRSAMQVTPSLKTPLSGGLIAADIRDVVGG